MKMETRNSSSRILRQSRGAITIFEMIPLYAVIFGICGGVSFGSHFGNVGGWIGGFIGGVVGWFSWRFLLVWIGKWLDRKRNLSNKSVEELQAMLRDPKCKIPNVALLELGVRGEKMENYLPAILDLLVSPLMETRRRGWLTLTSVFPERAKIISDYRVDDSVEKCEEKIRSLRPA